MARSDFLSYGGADVAAALDLEGTREYLESLGFGNGDLAQARRAIEARTEEVFTFDAIGTRYCDFCYSRIMGGEYDELKDGRERCSRCSRTVIVTQEQFVEEFALVRQNMEIAFGITLGPPMTVKMANAREIARQTGERFVATPGVDPRVLGFAAKLPDGHVLYVENGAPRMAAVTTMAHELTHIWQHANWNEASIDGRYGKRNRLFVYEGMATWAQVRYLLFIREFDAAKRQEAYARLREDEYGIGFALFAERYPLNPDGDVGADSPFLQPYPL